MTIHQDATTARLTNSSLVVQARCPRHETAWLMLTFQSRCVICLVEPCSLGGTRGCAAVREAVRWRAEPALPSSGAPVWSTRPGCCLSEGTWEAALRLKELVRSIKACCCLSAGSRKAWLVAVRCTSLAPAGAGGWCPATRLWVAGCAVRSPAIRLVLACRELSILAASCWFRSAVGDCRGSRATAAVSKANQHGPDTSVGKRHDPESPVQCPAFPCHPTRLSTNLWLGALVPSSTCEAAEYLNAGPSLDQVSATPLPLIVQPRCLGNNAVVVLAALELKPQNENN